MGKQAREASRRAREALAEQQRRTRRRHRAFALGGGVVIVGLLVAIVVVVVGAVGGSGGTGSDKPLVAPAGATPAGAVVVGSADAPVKLEVYSDYMCPYCGRFEQANGGDIEGMTADGTARLELYPLAFLDRMSEGSRYSTRAANALATVADRAPDKVLAFHEAMFAVQPAEGTSGLSDGKIAEVATEAGVPAEVVDAFADRTFEPWIAKLTKEAFDGDVTGTPTVKINGEVFEGDLYTRGPLAAAVDAAKDR